jgi:tetratricopeptide (TPR) repeat protein
MPNAIVPRRQWSEKSRMPDITDRAFDTFMQTSPLALRVSEILPSRKKKKGFQELFKRLDSIRQVHYETQRKIKETPQAIQEHLDEMMQSLLPSDEYANYEERHQKSREHLVCAQEACDLYKAHKDDPQEAVRVMMAYAEQRPQDAEALSYLAASHRNAGDLPGAIQAERRVIALSDTETELLTFGRRQILAKLLHENGESSAAISELQSVIREAPEGIALDAILGIGYFSLGTILWETGDTANARVAWKEAEVWDTHKIMPKFIADYLDSQTAAP